MSNDKRRKRRMHKQRKAMKQMNTEPGDLIPMDDFQRSFLAARGKFVYNPEMEAAMAADLPSDSYRMNFGTTPLPWEEPMSRAEFVALKNAKEKKFSCRNATCKANGEERTVNYVMVTHKKELSFNSESAELDELEKKRFGKRERVVIHCAVKCKECGRDIKYVPLTKTNRRAANDPVVNGPHQNRRR